MHTTLPLAQLIADPAVHPRTRIRQGTIRQYSDSYQQGDTLPPVDVFKAPDGRHFLADGFHRYYGARAAGQTDIAVELFEGDVREATRYACGANARHGIPRTREDKRFEIAAMLTEPEFTGMSDSEIAKVCRVSRQMIAKVKPQASSKDAFHQFMKEEAERRTLAREDRQLARKKSLAEARVAAATPPPLPTAPDRPLTPQEEAMASLARAAEAAGLARKAMAECGRAYPEANRVEAMIAMCEAQCHLDELLPGDSSPASQGVSNPQALALLKEFGVDLQAAPQPEKLHGSFPAPSHSCSGPGRGAGAPSAPANSKSFSAGRQLEKLQPLPALTPADLPATRRISSEKIAELFAPKPVHPMIAALNEGTIRNVPEVLPIHAKAAQASQAIATPLLPRQPEKLHPARGAASARRSRRSRKKRHRDGPQSSRSPPAG